MEKFDKKIKQAENFLRYISSHDIDAQTRQTLNLMIEAIELLADEVKKLKNDE
jgi:predicted GTPase